MDLFFDSQSFDTNMKAHDLASRPRRLKGNKNTLKTKKLLNFACLIKKVKMGFS